MTAEEEKNKKTTLNSRRGVVFSWKRDVSSTGQEGIF